MVSLLAKFEKDRYIHLKKAPTGIQADLKVTLDEFYLFDPNFEVERVFSKESTATNVGIESACRLMRKKRWKDPASYSLCLSLNEQLNQTIELPKMIKEKSFYEKYWPSGYLSNFFKYKHKLFHVYQNGYKSHPYISYGGLTEWLYISSGELSITLIEPTKINLCKYSALSEHEDLEPEKNTATSLTLEQNNFLVIPTGWISIRKAIRTTFAFGGELLHQDNIPAQMEAFDRDVTGLTSSCDSASDRDTEIRSLYWFFTMHLLNNPAALRNFPDGSLESLKSHLETWKAKSTRLNKTREPYLKPTMFVPLGIKADVIVRDLQTKSSHKRARRSLKGSKDPIDVTMIHLAVDN